MPGVSLLILAQQRTSADDPRDGVRSTIKARYDTYAAGMKNKNSEMVLRTLSPSFHFVEVNGQAHDLSDMRRALLEDFAAAPGGINDEFTLNSVQANGDHVLCTVIEVRDWSAAYGSSPLSNYHEATQSHDTWVRSQGAWRMERSEYITDVITRNGKPLEVGGTTQSVILRGVSIGIGLLLLCCLVGYLAARAYRRVRKR